MRAQEFFESPESELARKLPSLAKHNYDIVDSLVRNVAKKHKLSSEALNSLFKRKFQKTPADWIKGKLDETDTEELNIQDEVEKFAKWAAEKLSLETTPEIELSYDTQEAQDGHHTGRHEAGTGKVWVYAKNRNLVDILRTVFHELVHVRQGEKDMIKPGDSYPGSPIEVMADQLAGKYIKIYGEKNRHIFQ